mgnify:CR=1 FL=1
MKIWKFLLIIIITTFNLTCFKNCELFKESTTQIYGIDISHYQDDKSQIDWQTVSKNLDPHISFAYIRSTMGKDGVDKAFKYNFQEAQKNGIKVGVYHYYRPNEKADAQFENFLKNTPNIGDMPPVLDIEEIGDLRAAELRKELTRFLTLLKQKYNTEPIIYAPQRFYNTYLRNKFSTYRFWIARHNGIKESPDNNNMKKEPFLIDGRCPLIWQYSGTGKINGISGNVDLNITKKAIWN